MPCSRSRSPSHPVRPSRRRDAKELLARSSDSHPPADLSSGERSAVPTSRLCPALQSGDAPLPGAPPRIRKRLALPLVRARLNGKEVLPSILQAPHFGSNRPQPTSLVLLSVGYAIQMSRSSHHNGPSPRATMPQHATGANAANLAQLPAKPSGSTPGHVTAAHGRRIAPPVGCTMYEHSGTIGIERGRGMLETANLVEPPQERQAMHPVTLPIYMVSARQACAPGPEIASSSAALPTPQRYARDMGDPQRYDGSVAHDNILRLPLGRRPHSRGSSRTCSSMLRLPATARTLAKSS
jgi:hypothetical protein